MRDGRSNNDDDGDDNSDHNSTNSSSASSVRDDDSGKVPLSSPSFLVALFVGFVGAIEYAVIMPSVWPYVESMGGDKLWLGGIISIFSLMRTIFLPIIGRYSDRSSPRGALLIALSIGFVGNLIYAIAGDIGRLELVLLGRALAGLSASNSSVCMSYVSHVTTKKARTKGIVVMNGINLCGIVLGPAFNIGLARLSFDVPALGVRVTPLNSPGFLLCGTVALAFILVLFVFVDPPAHLRGDISDLSIIDNNTRSDEEPAAGLQSPILGAQAVVKSISRRNSTADEHYFGNGHDDADDDAMIINNQSPMMSPMMSPVRSSSNGHVDEQQQLGGLRPPLLTAKQGDRSFSYLFWEWGIKRGAITCFVITGCNNFMLSSLESVLTPITKTQYGWGPVQNSYMYAAMAGCGLMAIVTVGLLTSKVRDVGILLFGQLVELGALISMVIFCSGDEVSLVALMTTSGFLIYGLPIQGPPNMSLFSKLVEAQGLQAHRGYYFGKLQQVNGIARAVGPLSSNALLQYASRSVLFAYLLSVVVLSLSVVSRNVSKLTQVERLSGMFTPAAAAAATRQRRVREWRASNRSRSRKAVSPHPSDRRRYDRLLNQDSDEEQGDR